MIFVSFSLYLSLRMVKSRAFEIHQKELNFRFPFYGIDSKLHFFRIRKAAAIAETTARNETAKV